MTEIVLTEKPWHGLTNPTRGKFSVGQKTIMTIEDRIFDVEVIEQITHEDGIPSYGLKFPDGSVGRFRENEIY